MNITHYVDENDNALTNLNGVIGTLTAHDTYVLKHYMSEAKPNSLYVETGSYLGCSGILAGLVMKGESLVYCHDIWVCNMNELSIDSGIPPIVDDYFYQFYKNVRDNKLQHKVIPIRGDSKYTLGIHEDKSIDLAFIDGDHSYEGALNDLQAIYPKMKSDGVILCHDCRPNSQVLKAITEFATSKGILNAEGFIGSSIVSINLKQDLE